MLPKSLPQYTKVEYYIDGIINRNIKPPRGKIVGYKSIKDEKYYVIEPDSELKDVNLDFPFCKYYTHIICHEDWINPVGTVVERTYSFWERLVAAFANRHPRAIFK